MNAPANYYLSEGIATLLLTSVGVSLMLSTIDNVGICYPARRQGDWRDKAKQIREREETACWSRIVGKLENLRGLWGHVDGWSEKKRERKDRQQ